MYVQKVYHTYHAKEITITHLHSLHHGTADITLVSPDLKLHKISGDIRTAITNWT